MAQSNYIPQMYVDCLNDDEVKYELLIRGLFKSSDSKIRRKSRLKGALTQEQCMVNAPEYKSKYEFDQDFCETESILVIVKTVEHPFDAASVKNVESHTMHLLGRLKRMTVPEESQIR